MDKHEKIHNKRILLILLIIAMNSSCIRDSKWEEIKGKNITFNVPDAIYFENLNNGLVGSYRLHKNPNSKNYNHLDQKPLLYLTKNGGLSWTLLNINDDIFGGISNLYLSKDTIYCQIRYDSSNVYKSDNLGRKWKKLDLIQSKQVEEKLFQKNRYEIENHDFVFENNKFRIKEKYEFKNTIVIVCYGKETLTDYFFVSHNNGKNWIFSQKDFGSNKQKFIYKGQYLFSYESPYGLQRLKLKE